MLVERQASLSGATLLASLGLPTLILGITYLLLRAFHLPYFCTNISSHACSITTFLAPLKKKHTLSQGCIHAHVTHETAEFQKTLWMATHTQTPNGLATIPTAAGPAMTFSAIHWLETNSLATMLQSNWHARFEHTMSMEEYVIVDLERSEELSNSHQRGY